MTKYFASLMMLLAMVSFTACEESTSNEPSDATEETSQEAAPVASSATMVVLNDSIASPLKQVTGKIGEADVTITYGSPSVNGRTLWGDLVPYQTVWRTGANEATTFEVSQDVTIEGQTLPAGKYSLFTIPGEEDWTIIFNSVAEQWGAYEYDDTKDVMRVKVMPKEADSSETMDFDIRGNDVILMWGDLMVPFTVG